MNLRLGENRLYVIVRNTLIQVDPETLYEEFKIPLVINTETVPSRRPCLIAIIDNENLDFERDYFVRDFTPKTRPLHHIINKIFFPKFTRIDFVSQ